MPILPQAVAKIVIIFELPNYMPRFFLFIPPIIYADKPFTKPISRCYTVVYGEQFALHGDKPRVNRSRVSQCDRRK